MRGFLSAEGLLSSGYLKMYNIAEQVRPLCFVQASEWKDARCGGNPIRIELQHAHNPVPHLVLHPRANAILELCLGTSNLVGSAGV